MPMTPQGRPQASQDNPYTNRKPFALSLQGFSFIPKTLHQPRKQPSSMRHLQDGHASGSSQL
jgi:hypothetical protein